MEYSEVSELINNTLMGRDVNHEILPQEHQDMAQAILDFANGIQTTGVSVLQGFATASTIPAQPDASKVCYISVCPNNTTTTFTYFKDQNNNSLSVTTAEYEIAVAVLLWNMSYWEMQVQGFNFEDSITRNINGGDASGNF